MIFKGLNEKFFGHTLYVTVPPNILKPLTYLVFKNILKCCFYTMKFEVTCFNMSFRNCNSKSLDIYLISIFFDQNISQGKKISRNLGGKKFLQEFFLTLPNFKNNDRD